MKKRLLDYDPLSGITQYFYYDEDTGNFTIESVQDVESILDYNKSLQNDEDYKKNGMKNEFWHYARIPVVVQEKWLKEFGVDVHKKEDWPRVKKLLNDPDYRYLKTTTGRA